MKFDSMTDVELAKEADKGLRGLGAVIETMQRLTAAIESLDKSSTKQQGRIFWLTVAIGLFTVVAAAAAVVQAWAIWNR